VDAQFEDFKPFNVDKIWAKQNNLWGLITDKGQFLVRPIYHDVNKICNECDQVWIKKDDKWGLFSEKLNKQIISPKFSNIKPLSEFASFVEYNDSIGVVENSTGNYIFKPQLLKVQKIAHDYFAFKNREKKWGIMGKYANVTVEPIYDTLIKGEHNLLIISKEEKWGIIDYHSNVYIKPIFDKIEPFSEGQAVCVFEGKYGLINRSGRVFFKPSFDFIKPFKDGVSLALKDQRWGLIDMGGNPKFAFEYDWAYEINDKNLILFKKNNRYELIERKSLRKLLTEALEIDTIVSNNKIIFKSQQGYKYFDLKFLKIKPENAFEDAKPALADHLIVKNQGKWGVLNENGEILINYSFDSIQFYKQNGVLFFIVFDKHKCGLYEHHGKNLLPIEFDYISIEKNGTFKIKKNGFFAVADKSGNPITGFIYDYLSNSFENPNVPSYPSIFKKGKKMGLLNVDGKEIVSSNGKWFYVGDQLYAHYKEPYYELYKNSGERLSDEKFDSLQVFTGNLIPAKKGDKWGYLSMSGKWIINPQFEKVYHFKNNIAVVMKGEKYGIINSQGKWLSEPEFDIYIPTKNILVKKNKKYTLTEKGALKALL
jgi:hypothetical protein